MIFCKLPAVRASSARSEDTSDEDGTSSSDESETEDKGRENKTDPPAERCEYPASVISCLMTTCTCIFLLQCVPGARGWAGNGGNGKTYPLLFCTHCQAKSGQPIHYLSCPGFDTLPRSHGTCSQTLQDHGE